MFTFYVHEPACVIVAHLDFSVISHVTSYEQNDHRLAYTHKLTETLDSQDTAAECPLCPKTQSWKLLPPAYVV